jgi:tRNA threonylcarbamoyl adenosine modification protein (Sua5/YciO/YrdC/YwlC family)
LERINLPQNNSDSTSVVRKTAGVLRNGGIAVVPTETVYGLAACLNNAEAVKKIIQIKGRDENHPFAAAFPDTESIAGLGILLNRAAMRLCRCCLPGPVSLVLDLDPHPHRFRSLPEIVQKAVSKESAVCCRIPDHPLLLNILRELQEPVVLTSANRSGQGELPDIDQIINSIGSGIDLILDAGRITRPVPSTVVRITGSGYEILRQGVFPAETISRLLSPETAE